MTEAEWLACSEPMPMLAFLRGHVSDRKMRLFAVASCNRVWHELEEPTRSCVEASTKFADGLISKKQLREAHRPAAQLSKRRCYEAMANPASTFREFHLASMGSWTGDDFVYVAVDNTIDTLAKIDDSLCRTTAVILRDIFGNAFHPAALHPTWQTPKVVALAISIYVDQAFDHLPILAEALERAGCNDNKVLSHCREPGPHVRGCWALDLILGKA